MVILHRYVSLPEGTIFGGPMIQWVDRQWLGDIIDMLFDDWRDSLYAFNVIHLMANS